MRELGLPFWLAGGTGTADSVKAARARGAAGVQVGTLFAYCDESGLAPTLRAEVIAGVAKGATRIRTDPRASPTGYPFKVVEVEGMARQGDTRARICDLGYLRTAYRTSTGRLDYRCPAEPVETYLAKGGPPRGHDRTPLPVQRTHGQHRSPATPQRWRGASPHHQRRRAVVDHAAGERARELRRGRGDRAPSRPRVRDEIAMARSAQPPRALGAPSNGAPTPPA